MKLYIFSNRRMLNIIYWGASCVCELLGASCFGRDLPVIHIVAFGSSRVYGHSRLQCCYTLQVILQVYTTSNN